MVSQMESAIASVMDAKKVTPMDAERGLQKESPMDAEMVSMMAHSMGTEMAPQRD